MSDLFEAALMSLDMAAGKRTEDILKAYLATFFASLIDMRMSGKGTELTNDRNCMLLNRYSNAISPLNFWGTILFKSDSSEIKRKVGRSTSKELSVVAGRIMAPRTKQIHKQISTGNVDWEFMYDASKLLMVRLGQKTYNNDVITAGIYYWGELSENSKSTVISKVYNLLMSSNPESPYLTKLRSLSTSNLTSAGGPEDGQESVLKGILRLITRKKVTEDAEATNAETTTSGDVATNAKRLLDGKIIKRRKKNFSYTIFKAPKRFNIKKDKAPKDDQDDDK